MNPAAWSPWLTNLDAAAYLIVAALVIWLAFFGDRSKGRKRCPKCWYDMAAAPPPGLTCSECGHQCKTGSQLHKSRWRWRPVVWGALACLLTFTVSNWANLRAGAWLNLIPATVLFVVVEPDYTSPSGALPPRLMIQNGNLVAVPPVPPPPPSNSLKDVKQVLARELARRHKAGELPGWIWRRLSLRQSVIPIDRSRWLHTRPRWPKGQNLILGSEAAAALINASNPGAVTRKVRLEISAQARAMGIGGWASMIDNTFLPSRPVTEVRYHLDSTALQTGRQRIPLSITCREVAGGKTIDLWRSDHEIEVEIVDSIEKAIDFIGDEVTNNAVRLAASIALVESGVVIDRSVYRLQADLATPKADNSSLANLGAAFRLVFLEHGREVARRHDDLYPSGINGLVFANPEDEARLMSGKLWTDEAIQSLTVRIEGRPEAVLPQLDFPRAWTGHYEVPLSTLLQLQRLQETSASPYGEWPPTLLFEPAESVSKPR